MPSLDFDLEEAAFHGFHAQHRQGLEAALAQYLATLTEALAQAGGIEVSRMEGRIKDKAECVRKFSRKYRTALEESNTPYTIAAYISDLIGVRVVCLYEDEIDKITQAVRQHFEVIEVTDKTAAVEGTESAFGYKGLHLDLKPRWSAETAPLLHGLPLAAYPFELQVRTIVQDAWAVLDHKIKYKKSIPGALKRRINVLAALFELADREFRQIRDATEAQLLAAPDDTETTTALTLPQEQMPVVSSDLNAFTFLKIASHFFNDYSFDPGRVDSFVADVQGWAPGITRTGFNTLLRENIGTVKRYKQHIEEQRGGRKLNPYAVMRHSLYLGNKEQFAAALGRFACDTFEAWLREYKPATGPS